MGLCVRLSPSGPPDVLPALRTHGVSKIEPNAPHAPVPPSPPPVSLPQQALLILCIVQARTLGIALDCLTLSLPPARVLPSSDDAPLIHSPLSTFTPAQNLQHALDGGRLRECVSDRLLQEGKHLGQGRGPSAAGGWPERSGVSVGGQSLQTAGGQQAALRWGSQRETAKRTQEGVVQAKPWENGPGVTPALTPSGEACCGLWENN